MNNSYITIIKEKRTVLSRKRVPLNQNECTADFRIGVPFEQNLQNRDDATYAPRVIFAFSFILLILSILGCIMDFIRKIKEKIPTD